MHSQENGNDRPGMPFGASQIHHAATGQDSTSAVATLSPLAMSHLSRHRCAISILKYHDWKQAVWALEPAVLLSTTPLKTSPNATYPWFGERDSDWPQTNVPPASPSPVLGLQAGATFYLTVVP